MGIGFRGFSWDSDQLHFYGNLNTKLQDYCDKFNLWIEQRFKVAAAHLENEVRMMFEKEWLSKGGRWDTEGFKLELAAKLGVENMEA